MCRSLRALLDEFNISRVCSQNYLPYPQLHTNSYAYEFIVVRPVVASPVINSFRDEEQPPENTCRIVGLCAREDLLNQSANLKFQLCARLRPQIQTFLCEEQEQELALPGTFRPGIYMNLY